MSIEDRLSDSRITVMGLFVEAYAGVQAYMGAHRAQHDVSFAELDALLRLGRSPDHRMRMTDLAAQTGLTTSGTTRLADRLEARGLITREIRRGDRRGTDAALTHAGMTKLDALLQSHVEAIESCVTGLFSPDELTAFTQAIRRIRDTTRPQSTEGTDGPATSRS